MTSHSKKIDYSSSTALDGSGSFRRGNLLEGLAVANLGWQSESTDGLHGGGSCVFRNGCNGCSVHLIRHGTLNCWMYMVYRSCSCNCSVVEL